MPEQDLAAALAAVEVDESAEMSDPDEQVEEEAVSPLRSERELVTFYAALDEEDFVAASDELVHLSSELDAGVVDQLTAEMEAAVSSMGLAAVEEEEAPMEIATITPDPEPTDPVVELTPLPDNAPTPPPVVAPSDVVAYFSLVQSGDFETAKGELSRLSKLADPATVASMKAALSAAQTKQKELLASQEQLKKSQAEMARLQKESVTQIQESVKQLAEVTKAAKEATEEATRLKGALANTKVTASAPEPPKKKPAPVKLPETKSVSFGFDSTYLSEASKTLLTTNVLSALRKESGLNVQLRGHADARGASDYNGILAQARCEVVKDFLLEKGIESNRITLVSFGETQAAASGGTPEELRRVDVIFRAN